MADERVRIDRWLWAARFYKTRGLATEAVDGGKVHVNGERVKAAKAIRPGDRLRVRRGADEVELVVVGLADQRGPATAAQALYRETDESAARRHAQAEQRRLYAAAAPRFDTPRDKRARRAISRFKRGDQG